MGCLIVAEAGLNHHGMTDEALKLARAAKMARADAVKFQTYVPEKVIRKTDPDFGQLSELALSKAETLTIASFCEAEGIEFMSTPGDIESLEFLVEKCKVKRLKIGSDDLTNWPLLTAAAKAKLPLIVSTGMATFGEMEQVIGHLRRQGLDIKNNLTLLHCVSLYPCALIDVNLNVIKVIREQIGVSTGYSDHSMLTIACVAAAALGVTVIEKHLRLAGDTACIDAAVSAEPDAFTVMVQQIRFVEAALGNGIKRFRPEEIAQRARLRKDPSDWLRGINVQPK